MAPDTTSSIVAHPRIRHDPSLDDTTAVRIAGRPHYPETHPSSHLATCSFFLAGGSVSCLGCGSLSLRILVEVVAPDNEDGLLIKDEKGMTEQYALVKEEKKDK